MALATQLDFSQLLKSKQQPGGGGGRHWSIQKAEAAPDAATSAAAAAAAAATTAAAAAAAAVFAGHLLPPLLCLDSRNHVTPSHETRICRLPWAAQQMAPYQPPASRPKFPHFH